MIHLKAVQISEQAHELSPCGQARDRVVKLGGDRILLGELLDERATLLEEVQRKRKAMHFTAPLADVSRLIMQEVTLKEWLRQAGVYQTALAHETHVQETDYKRLLRKAKAAYEQMVANEHPGMGRSSGSPLDREQGRKRTFEQAQLTYNILTQDPALTPDEQEQARMHEEWALAAKERYAQDQAEQALQATSIYGQDERVGGTAPDEEEYYGETIGRP